MRPVLDTLEPLAAAKNEPVTPPVMPGQAVEATPAPKAEEKSEEKQTKQDEKAEKKSKKHGQGLNMVIVLAVLVAFLLIGLAFVALQSEDADVSEGNSQTSQINDTSLPAREDTNSEPVDTADVEEQINELDQTLENLDESQFSDDELSDESLGL